MEHRATTKDVMSHQLGQSQVHVDGDRAGAETYFIATIQENGADGAAVIHQMGGRYVDELVRESGDWKVRHRSTVRDWSFSLPVASDWIGSLGFIPGRTDGDDPSFEALRLRHSARAKPA
jgi:hypothetical protein